MPRNRTGWQARKINEVPPVRGTPHFQQQCQANAPSLINNRRAEPIAMGDRKGNSIPREPDRLFEQVDASACHCEVV